MIANSQSRELGSVTCWSEFTGLVKKNPLTSEVGVRGFSKSGLHSLFLMKIVGWC
jgi:hypothetical protein